VPVGHEVHDYICIENNSDNLVLWSYKLCKFNFECNRIDYNVCLTHCWWKPVQIHGAHFFPCLLPWLISEEKEQDVCWDSNTPSWIAFCMQSVKVRNLSKVSTSSCHWRTSIHLSCSVALLFRRENDLLDTKLSMLISCKIIKLHI